MLPLIAPFSSVCFSPWQGKNLQTVVSKVSLCQGTQEIKEDVLKESVDLNL